MKLRTDDKNKMLLTLKDSKSFNAKLFFMQIWKVKKVTS
jgi:hypothetical protein